MMQLRVLLVGAWFLVTAAGCGNDGDPVKQGTATLREVCTAIASTLCEKMAACSPPGTPQCLETFTASCCPAGVDCDKRVEGSGGKDSLNDCLDDFRHLTCAQIMSGATPLDCR